MIGILITLIIIGVLLYIVNTLIPMDQKIKTIINVLVVIVVVVWLLQTIGVVGHLDNIRIR